MILTYLAKNQAPAMSLVNSVKKRPHSETCGLLASGLLALLFLSRTCGDAQAQATAFTYQGRLNDGGSPANGAYDLRFTLFDSITGGSQQRGALTYNAVAVSNGLFTLALDFGSQFPGADRFLEIGARTNGGASFTTLTPR